MELVTSPLAQYLHRKNVLYPNAPTIHCCTDDEPLFYYRGSPSHRRLPTTTSTDMQSAIPAVVNGVEIVVGNGHLSSDQGCGDGCCSLCGPLTTSQRTDPRGISRSPSPRDATARCQAPNQLHEPLVHLPVLSPLPSHPSSPRPPYLHNARWQALAHPDSERGGQRRGGASGVVGEGR